MRQIKNKDELVVVHYKLPSSSISNKNLQEHIRTFAKENKVNIQDVLVTADIDYDESELILICKRPENKEEKTKREKENAKLADLTKKKELDELARLAKKHKVKIQL